MAGPIRVRLFATARVAVGRPSLGWPAPDGGVPARVLVAELARAYPPLAATLKVSRFLRNGRYLRDLDETVLAGDEFAVHPPYGGG